MSLPMFMHQEKSALILTDTLATTPDGEPFMFHSKAWAIPHKNMADGESVDPEASGQSTS